MRPSDDPGIPLSDAELAARCAAGDERAFADLMGRHQKMLLAVCLRITGDRDDAFDALQETLTRAWRSLGRYRGDARMATWLYRIAVNASLDETRRRARRPVPVDGIPDHGFGTRAGPEDAVVGRLTLDEALARLPPPYRTAVVLRELCGCTYEEIADVLGTPVNTVKTRISRARRALLALLAVPAEPTPRGGA